MNNAVFLADVERAINELAALLFVLENLWIQGKPLPDFAKKKALFVSKV